MAAVDTLRERIEDYIQPFRDSDTQPSLKEEHIITMALVMADQPMTIEEIHRWRTRTFGFYRGRAFRWAWETQSDCSICYGEPWKTFREIREDMHNFKAGFRQFEPPISISHSMVEEEVEENDLSGTVKKQETVWWQVSRAEANLYLQDVLQGPIVPEASPFPFMRLPAELRLRIYETLFALPQVGVNISCGSISTLSRTFSKLKMREEWYLGSEYLLHEGVLGCSSITTAMNLLATNRQVYKEAMPVFFTINHFAFRNAFAMLPALKAIPPVRREHSNHISFALNSLGRFGDETLCGLLSCTGLKRLDVFFWETSLFESCPIRHPGVLELLSMTYRVEVRIHGDIEQLKHIFADSAKLRHNLTAENWDVDRYGALDLRRR